MKVGTRLDREGVLRVLPHRDPFLFIDSVETIFPGENENKPGNGAIIGRRIIAHYRVRPEEPFFKGHFPGHPIMPGVLLLEVMAQASAILAYDPEIHGERLEVLLVSAKEARFRKPVLPGDQLKVESTAVELKRQFFHFDCAVYKGPQKVCEAQLIASFGQKLEPGNA